MKLPARSVVWLLPLMLTACFHKTHQTQVQPPPPPIAEVPVAKPEPVPAELPPQVAATPVQPATPDASTTTPPKEAPKPPVKHKKPVNKNPQQASNGTPGVSAIGQLSSGDPSDLRRQTWDTITTTERGLNGIGRKLNDQEQKTSVQIREFLKQAKAALSSGDVDGAHTLASKAKVLLGELRR
jgi:hypothetical protein